MDRYSGKPFLRVLECYVLWAIGELSDKDQQTLVAMTPKFAEIYKRQGSWQEIVAGVMDFPADIPAHISACWEENRERALRNNEQLLPDHFAQMFVDQNIQD
jgi:hypothetical protein